MDLQLAQMVAAAAEATGLPEELVLPAAAGGAVLCAAAAYAMRCARADRRSARRAKEEAAEQGAVLEALAAADEALTEEQIKEFGDDREEDRGKDPRGVMKEHGVHIFYGTGEGSSAAWPRRVESAGGPGAVWREQLDAVTPDGAERPKVNMTAYTGREGDVLVFPARVRYSLGAGGLDAATVAALLVRHVPGAVMPQPAPAPAPEEEEEEAAAAGPPPELPEPEAAAGCYTFVCTHGERDMRCGVAGVQLARRLVEVARSRGLLPTWFKTYGCSHIGGHKFAGNVLVFADRATLPREPGFDGRVRPEGSTVCGDWYGKISHSDADVSALLDCIEAGIPLLDKWRGRTGLAVDAAHRLLKNDDPDWVGCGEGCACAAAEAEARKKKYKINAMTL